VFYEMLTGRLPFDDKSPYALMAAVVQAQIPDVAVLNSEVDPNTLAILSKMLARRPAERFQTCAEVVNALESGASASPLPPPRNASASVAPPMMPSPALAPVRLPTPPIAYPAPGYPVQPQLPSAAGYGAGPQNYAPAPSVVMMPPQKSSLMPWALGGLGALAVGGWLMFAPASKTLITPEPVPAPAPIPEPSPPTPTPQPDPAPEPLPTPDPPPNPNPNPVAITDQNMQTLLGTYTGKIGKAEFLLALQQETSGRITGYNLADGKRREVKGFVESFNEDIDADGDTWRVFNVVLEEPGDEDNDGKFRVEIKHTEKYVAGSGSWTSFTGTQQFDIAISNYNSKRD
jgi:serine/threonine protein kinase